MCGQRCMWITMCLCSAFFFFFNDTATTEIYTLSLHDALPICEADPEDEEGAAEIYRTFGECRFALQEALRQWAENAEARRGLQELIELMIGRELGLEDYNGARRLLRELPEPSPELEARLEALHARMEAERATV